MNKNIERKKQKGGIFGYNISEKIQNLFRGKPSPVVPESPNQPMTDVEEVKQKLEQQKLEQQKLEEQKLEQQKLEEQKIEQQKLEEQKMREDEKQRCIEKCNQNVTPISGGKKHRSVKKKNSKKKVEKKRSNKSKKNKKARK
jgi:hypothetical protein